MPEKIQKVTRDVLYVDQATYEIWGLNVQNWQNAIKGGSGAIGREQEIYKPDFYDPT